MHCIQASISLGSSLSGNAASSCIDPGAGMSQYLLTVCLLKYYCLNLQACD